MATIQEAVKKNISLGLGQNGKERKYIAPAAPTAPGTPGDIIPVPVRTGIFNQDQALGPNVVLAGKTNAPLRSPIFPVQPPVQPNNLATKTNLKFSHAAATNAVPGVGVLSATQTTIPPTPSPVQPQPIGNPPVVGPQPTPRNPSPGPPGLQKIPLQSAPVPVSPRTPIGVTGPTNNPAPVQSSPTPTAPRLKTTGAMTLDQISPGLQTGAILQSRSVQGVAYNYRGVWSQYLQYLAGDEVVYQTSYWKALTSSVDSTPGTGNADWQVVGSYSAFEGAWSSSTAYAAGAEVTYNGNFWVAVNANTNSAPSTSNSNWQIAGPADLDDVADGTTFKRILDVNSDNTFHVSTPFNNQGNLPAISYGNTPFTFTGSYNSTYATKPCALLNWGAISNQLANGSSASLTAATTMYPVPSAPTVTTASGGSFASNTYSFAVGIVYETPSGVYLIYSISPQTNTLVAANDTATIDSPSNVTGAVGWVPLVGLSDVYLSSTYINVAGSDIENYVAFGTNVTLNSWSGGTGYSGGLANLTGYSSGSGGSGIYYFGLATNTTYYCYPYYIISSGVIITNSIPLSAKSYLLAAEQSGDGSIALTNGSVSVTTPSSSGGSGGSTGSPGGGRGTL